MHDEVLDAAIAYLSIEDVYSLASTSRSVRATIRDQSTYWHSLNLTMANSSCLRRLIPYAKNIVSFQCRKSVASEEAWIHFACHTRKLKFLDVSGSKHFSGAALAAFADYNSNSLEEVCADNCAYIESISSLQICSAQLRTLSLNRCRLLHTTEVIQVAMRSHKLEVLNLKGCPKVNPVDTLSKVLNTCPKLTVLTLGGSGRFSKYTDEELMHSFSGNQILALKHLDISCSNPFGSGSPLSDKGILPLLRLTPALEELHLKGHSNLSRIVLNVIPDTIKVLDLTGCTQLSASLDALAYHSSLEQLIMYSCPNVPETVLKSLKETNSNLTKVDLDTPLSSSYA